MDIVYSDHVRKRMRQRGIEDWEIEQVLISPKWVKKSFDGRKVALGEIKQRMLKVVYLDEESYIKVISVMFL